MLISHAKFYIIIDNLNTIKVTAIVGMGPAAWSMYADDRELKVHSQHWW
jgi:hypothetical protein